jgi:predicted DNA-binding ribbon-helix-helix protein
VVSVRLEPAVFRIVQRVAEEMDVPVSEAIRQILDEWLKKPARRA